MTKTSPPPRDPWRWRLRRLWRDRRLRLGLALTLLALAGLSAIGSDSGTVPVRGDPVLVAARDIAAGSVLADADVRAALLPADLVPEGVIRPDQPVAGQRVIGAVRRGEALTDARLVPPGPPRIRVASGVVAIPIRLADPAVATLLKPGDRVDVLTAAEAERVAQLVIGDVPVLAVTESTDEVAAEGRLVLVAAPDKTAPTLVAAALNRRLAVTLRPP